MLQQERLIRSRIQMLLDSGLFALAFYWAHALRAQIPFEIFGGTPSIQPFHEYAWLLLAVIPGAPLALQWAGFYNRPVFATRRPTAWALCKACIWMPIALILLIFLLRQTHIVARSVIIYFGAISFVLAMAKEEVILRWRRTSLAKAQLQNRLILVGVADDLAQLEQELAERTQEDFTVVARLDINETPVERLVELLHKHSANGVILAARHTFFGQLEDAIAVCEREGVEVWLVADFFKTRISKTTVDQLYGRPMLVFRSVQGRPWAVIAKQAIDFAGASLLLLILAIPMLIVALLIRLTSPGAVLFRQQRSGLNGQPFTMLKFRSMASDAEQRRHELEALNEMNGPVFKLSNDPRITPVGRFLRRFSIDELPQLINVWRGEMSLVGPRPLPVDEVRRFDDPAHRRRLSVRPGLTCLWQVSGRNNVRDFQEWVRLDLEYIDHWSLGLDMKILARTIPIVLSGAGAK